MHPYDPTKKLHIPEIPAGCSPMRSPEAEAFQAQWQAHLDAGNLPGALMGRGANTTRTQLRQHVRHDRLFTGAQIWQGEPRA